jgi:hypothetical protein
MKKWLPTCCGLLLGALLGVYLLCVGAEASPDFIRFRVEHISDFLSKHLTSNTDPLGGFAFLGPVCVLFCALPGALIGFSTGALLNTMRRRRIQP